MIEPRKNFTIRLSDEEREQAEYDAKANNMKLSDYVRYGALESVDSSLKAREAVEKYCKETGIYNIHESNNVYIYYTGIRIKKIRKSQAVTIQKLIQSYGIPNVNIRQMSPNEL